MKEIHDDLFVDDRFSAGEDYRGCNYGFVETSEGIVVIDTPEWPSESVSFRDEIRDRGEPKFVINTHEDFDHVAGNFFIPGNICSHEKVRNALTGPLERSEATRTLDYRLEGETAREKIERIDRMEDGAPDWEDLMRMIFEEIDPDSLEYLDGYQMTPPDVTFSANATLHIGQYTFELLHTPGHTASHICVYIPELQVLFTGDTVTNGCYPSMAVSDPFEWIESIRTLESLQVDRVVPGHGDVCDGEVLTEFRAFLESCVERVREGMDNGLSKAELVERVSFSESLPPVHPTEGAHESDINRLYDSLS